MEKLPVKIKNVIDMIFFFYTDMQLMLLTLVMITSCRNLQNRTILSQMYNTIGLKTHFQACRQLYINKEHLFECLQKCFALLA